MFVDIQKLVNVLSEAGNKERANYHLTLGQLIEKLEKANPTAIVHIDCDKFYYPTTPHSYRGYYDDLAFGSRELGEPVKADDFLKICKDALNNTFEGWKGGSYIMDARTPLWISEPGDVSSVAVIGCVCTGDSVKLQVKIIEDF